MAALTCDICGGKLTGKPGGVFECDSCGMEYSTEWAKQKVQEIKGVVQVDNTHMVENYMRLACNAYDSDNKREAEEYCNKVIEIVPTHKDAWLLKGRAAGWQSTLGNIRIPEAINCFANAIQYAGDQEKADVVQECKDEVASFSEALIRLRGERFEKWPDEEERNGFLSDATVILRSILQFFNATGSLIDKNELMAPVADGILTSVSNAWDNVILPRYEGDHDGHPDDYELDLLMKRSGYCTDLLTKAIELADGDLESDEAGYYLLIQIHSYMINAKSYSYETVHTGYSSWDGSKIYENKYVVSKKMTDASIKERRRLITSYESKIKELEAQMNAKEKKERDDYWNEHQDEGSKLKAERKAMEARRAEIQKQYKTLTDEKEKEKLEDEAEKIWKKLDNIDTKLNGKRSTQSQSRDGMKREINSLKDELPKMEEDLKYMSSFHPRPGLIIGSIPCLALGIWALALGLSETGDGVFLVFLLGVVFTGFGGLLLKSIFPESRGKRNEQAQKIASKKNRIEELKFELL